MKINQRKAGVILSYAGQLTKILISIIYTPIMLRLLGQSEYVCNPLLALPLLIMGYGSIGMVAVTTFLTLLVLVMNVYYSFHNLHIRFCFKKFQLDLLKEMWVFTFFIFINQIIDQINWSVDKFLLGRFAGTTAVAVYGVGGQINSMYQVLSQTLSQNLTRCTLLQMKSSALCRIQMGSQIWNTIWWKILIGITLVTQLKDIKS